MKMTEAQVRRRLKNKEMADKLSGKFNSEPTVEEGNKSQLGTALSWYSSNTNKKDQKKYALEFFKANDKETYTMFSKYPDWAFMTLGSVCRLKTRGQWVDPNSTFFDKRIADLKKNQATYLKIEDEGDTDPSAPAKVVKPVVTVQDRIRDKASEVGGEIEGEIDEYADAGYPKDFKIKTTLATLSPQVAKILLKSFEPLLEELTELIGPAPKKADDMYDQLIEGYSHLNKRQQKYFHGFIKGLCDALRQATVVKAKPRRIKPKLPAQVVKHLKFKLSDEALGLKSIDKTKLVDSLEVYLYNTKARKIQRYVAAAGETISVKGTSLIGYDINQSTQRTVRKPEQVKDLQGKTKRPMKQAFDALKTKDIKVNGRVNADCIILGAFV